MSDYTEIPNLDWRLSQNQGPDKEGFLSLLRHAMVNVGFCYLSHHPVSEESLRLVKEFTPKFFELPQEYKDAVDMEDSAHFHGYLKVNGHTTVGKDDTREQFNFAADRTCRYVEGGPEYVKQQGDALWPKEGVIPGFKKVMSDYYTQVEDLSYKFTTMVSEALGLRSDALDSFFDEDRTLMQPRCKLLRYPPPSAGRPGQGIGAHVDGSFLTFLLQATDHKGLEVQNQAGQWIPVPPIDGAFVVNLGRALEKITKGVALATSHRVLSPTGPSPRYSVAFFCSVSMETRLADSNLEFPQEILDMVKAREEVAGKKTEYKLTDSDKELQGIVKLLAKVRTHPAIAKKYYPELYKKYFPDGKPLITGAVY